MHEQRDGVLKINAEHGILVVAGTEGDWEVCDIKEGICIEKYRYRKHILQVFHSRSACVEDPYPKRCMSNLPKYASKEMHQWYVQKMLCKK